VHRCQPRRYRVAQGLGGIKEVKIAGLEKGYLRCRQASRTFERRRSSLQVFSGPRATPGVIAIGGMLLVIMALLVRNDGNLLAVLPAIAVYAFAGVRLLPVMQVLYRAAVALRASGPAVDRLQREFAEDEVGPELTMPQTMLLTRAIQLRHINFAYPNAERTALRDVSLTIPVHATVGFVGKTGAGKTTIIDLILGLLEPQEGLLVTARPSVNTTSAPGSGPSATGHSILFSPMNALRPISPSAPHWRRSTWPQ
jgi:ABC-type multidrug transport system fused ATPase/permease subunit